MVQEEIDNRWVDLFPGDEVTAQSQFPTGICRETWRGLLSFSTTTSGGGPIGGRLKSTAFHSRKEFSLSSATDILRSYPIRNSSDDQLGLSIDIKSAHKRVAIGQSERGLVGLSWQNRLHFYRVCPFGATFSAHWWSRLGGFLLRLCHRMLYISHIGLLYVDDFIFSQSDKVLPISACLILLLFQAIRLPISWRKCELSHSVVWIGWKFNFLSGLVSIPQEKQKKLLALIDQLRSHQRVPLKSLQKFLGLAMWITQLFGQMRIWLHYLYMDIRSGRVWLPIRDPTSSRRVLSKASQRILSLFQSWLEYLRASKSMWPKPTWMGNAAADACAL